MPTLPLHTSTHLALVYREANDGNEEMRFVATMQALNTLVRQGRTALSVVLTDLPNAQLNTLLQQLTGIPELTCTKVGVWGHPVADRGGPSWARHEWHVP